MPCSTEANWSGPKRRNNFHSLWIAVMLARLNFTVISLAETDA